VGHSFLQPNLTERVIAPAQLRFVDVVTSSHNHTDHLDAETLQPILERNPNCRFVIPEANRDFVCERLKLPEVTPVGLNAGESANIAGFEIHAVPAAHEDLATDKTGRHIYMGYVVKFGPWSVYHSGDTVLFPGMVEWLKPHQVTVALLPINGRAPERRVAGNLDGAEAAQLAKDIGARMVIPCHYEMFEFNTASPDSLVKEAARLAQPVHLLRAGERWSSFGRGL